MSTHATGGRAAPTILLYGTVELWFSPCHPFGLTGIWWEAGDKGAFRLAPACQVQDWAFTPDWSFAKVEDYLRERDIAFHYHDAPSGEPASAVLVLPGGVTITFDGDRLYAVYAPQ